jgi:hypothetical protein
MPNRNRDRASRSGPTTAVVAAICGAEILSLAGYSIVPALLPRLIADWSLTNSEGGWLAGTRPRAICLRYCRSSV